MNYRSNREKIDNPTIDKLFQKVKEYSGKSINEQETPNDITEKPVETKPNIVAPADPTPTQPQASQNTQIASKENIYVAKLIANHMLILLGAVISKTPAVSDPKVNTDGLLACKTMKEFIGIINLGISNAISSTKGDEGYVPLKNEADLAMKNYIDALSKLKDYSDSANMANFGASLKDSIQLMNNGIQDAAEKKKQRDEALSKISDSSTDQSKATGFGDFVNFKTYESWLLEQKDDVEEIEKSGEDVLSKIKGYLKIAEDKKNQGKEKGYQRTRNKIFKLLINGTAELLSSINSVHQNIKIGINDQVQRTFSAFKKDPAFSQIGAELNTLQAKLNTNDPASIESIRMLVKTFKSITERYNNLKIEYDRELEDNERNSLTVKNNKEAMDLIITGNDHKEAAMDFKYSTPKIQPLANNKKVENNKDKTTGKESTTQIIHRPDGHLSFNQGVADFQNLVYDKFKDADVYKKSPIYSMFFGKFKGDGLFGKNTAAVIKSLKAGFGLKDSTYDITPELIEKIKDFDGKISESHINFIEYIKIYEQFNAKAAGEVLAHEINQIKISNKSYSADKTIAKKISNQEVKDRVGHVTQEDMKKYREEYVKLGAKPIDEAGRSAVAEGKGIRFYANGKALRTWDKVFGTVDISQKKFICDDNQKDKDDLDYLIKNEIPSLYIRVVEKIKGQFKSIMSPVMGDLDKDLFKRLTENWEEFRIKNISCVYTRKFKKEDSPSFKFNGKFYHDLGIIISKVKGSTNYDSQSIKGFWDKWESTLKEYDDTLQEISNEKEKERISSSMD